MPGAPYAEILIDPLGDKPEFHPLERRFERDIDRAVLELPLDQLQPDRPLAHRHEAQRAHAQRQGAHRQLAGFTEQCASPHVERHAMRRHLAGVVQQGSTGQPNPHVQPVGGWNKHR